MSSLAPCNCKVEYVSWLEMASMVSKLEPIVSTFAGPLRSAVQWNHTLDRGSKPTMFGSPASAVARTLLLVIVAAWPGIHLGLPRLSFFGGFSAHCSLMSPCG